MRAVISAFRNLQHRYQAQSRARRELLLLAATLLFAVTLLPLAIWLAGQYFLGDYVRSPTGAPTGGPLALIADYLRAVASGSPAHWLVLLGPYLLICGFRIGRYLLKT